MAFFTCQFTQAAGLAFTLTSSSLCCTWMQTIQNMYVLCLSMAL